MSALAARVSQIPFGNLRTVEAERPVALLFLSEALIQSWGHCIWRHGEYFKENTARYERFIVDEEAEDKADPKHMDAYQEYVYDSSVRVVVLKGWPPLAVR